MLAFRKSFEKMEKFESTIHNLLFLMSYFPEQSKEYHLKILLKLIERVVEDDTIVNYVLKDDIFYALIDVLSPSINLVVSGIKSDNDETFNSILLSVIKTIAEIDHNIIRNTNSDIIKILSELESEFDEFIVNYILEFLNIMNNKF